MSESNQEVRRAYALARPPVWIPTSIKLFNQTATVQVRMQCTVFLPCKEVILLAETLSGENVMPNYWQDAGVNETLSLSIGAHRQHVANSRIESVLLALYSFGVFFWALCSGNYAGQSYLYFISGAQILWSMQAKIAHLMASNLGCQH